MSVNFHKTVNVVAENYQDIFWGFLLNLFLYGVNLDSKGSVWAEAKKDLI